MAGRIEQEDASGSNAHDDDSLCWGCSSPKNSSCDMTKRKRFAMKSDMAVRQQSRLSKEQFEANYALRSKIGISQLRARQRVYPCNCNEEICEGWQSVNPVLHWEDRIMRANWWSRWWMCLVLAGWRLRLRQ